MTPARYKLLLGYRGLSQRGGATALFGIQERASRRWAADPPKTAAIILALMQHYGLEAADVESILTQQEGDHAPNTRA